VDRAPPADGRRPAADRPAGRPLVRRSSCLAARRTDVVPPVRGDLAPGGGRGWPPPRLPPRVRQPGPAGRGRAPPRRGRAEPSARGARAPPRRRLRGGTPPPPRPE